MTIISYKHSATNAVLTEKYRKMCAICSKKFFSDASKARPGFYNKSVHATALMQQEQRPVLVQSLLLPFPEAQSVKALFRNSSPLLPTHSSFLSATLGRLSPGPVLPSHM